MMTLTRRQRGFTLIEISIAMLIGLFLIGGLLVMLQSNRRAFTGQDQLAQLQDNQRIAMTMITDVIQSAGYFPNPVANTAAGLLTAAPAFQPAMIAGQSIYGTVNSAALGDRLIVRFATAPTDGILNCIGTANPNGAGGANVVYINEFRVRDDGMLVCQLNDGAATTEVELISGVTNMTVMYGVKRNAATTNNSVDTYLTTAQMTAADWNNVIAVRVSLTFTNPTYIAGQAAALQTINFTRVVGVMNQTGVKL